MRETIVRRKKQLIVTLVVLIIAVIGVFRYISAHRAPTDVVTASGTIEAIEMDVSPRVSGRILVLNVEEGDGVKKGQIIAVLDAKELNARVSQAQGNLLTAQARLADLVRGSREEKIREAYANYQKALASARGAEDVYGTVTESHYKSTELKSNVVTAEANYKAALRHRDATAARLTLVKKGPRQEDIDRLRANLDSAKAQHVSAEQDYKRYSTLYKEGAISGQQYDASLAARDSAKAAFDAAEANYNAAIAGSRPEEKDEAAAQLAEADARLVGAKDVLAAAKEAYTDRLQSLQQVKNARTTSDTASAQVKAAKAQLDMMLNGATSDEIRVAQGQVEQAQGALAEAKSQLSQATILAPEDGVVTVKSREVGEVVSVGTPIVRIANLNKVWLRVYAPLPTLGKIKTGQSASVRTDTYRGKVYNGEVESIKEEPEFTPKNVQTAEERVKLVYAIRVSIDNASRELKPGMPADADIRLSSGSSERQ